MQMERSKPTPIARLFMMLARRSVLILSILLRLMTGGLVFHPDVASAAEPALLAKALTLDLPSTPAGRVNVDAGAAQLSANGQHLVFVRSSYLTVTNANDLTVRGPFLDVFIRDLAAGTNRLVSLSQDGTGGGDDNSSFPALSADGRYVAYVSEASNLVTNDFNHTSDVFVRAVVLGKTTLVSVNAAGSSSGNNRSQNPVITPDGRYVAFESLASDLVPGDLNGIQDIFLRDLQTGTTTLVTPNAQAQPGNTGFSESPAMSDDGRFVVFASKTVNLVPGATSLARDIYVRDQQSGVTMRITQAVSSSQHSFNPEISADGRFISFMTSGGTLTSLYWRDLQSPTNVLLTTKAIGDVSRFYDDDGPKISADGQVVCYTAQERTGLTDVYVWDAQTGQSNLVSVSLDGSTPANGSSESPLMSSDGSTVAFLSRATDLTTNAPNASFQLYVRDLAKRTTRLASVNQSGAAAGRSDALYPTLSADGRAIAFQSFDGDLVTGDANNRTDIFFVDLAQNAVGAFRISAVRLSTDGKVTLEWSANTGLGYRVQFKNSLEEPDWKELPDPPAVNNGVAIWKEPTPASSGQRFYRVAALP